MSLQFTNTKNKSFQFERCCVDVCFGHVPHKGEQPAEGGNPREANGEAASKKGRNRSAAYRFFQIKDTLSEDLLDQWRGCVNHPKGQQWGEREFLDELMDKDPESGRWIANATNKPFFKITKNRSMRPVCFCFVFVCVVDVVL